MTTKIEKKISDESVRLRPSVEFRLDRYNVGQQDHVTTAIHASYLNPSENRYYLRVSGLDCDEVKCDETGTLCIRDLRKASEAFDVLAEVTGMPPIPETLHGNNPRTGVIAPPRCVCARCLRNDRPYIIDGWLTEAQGRESIKFSRIHEVVLVFEHPLDHVDIKTTDYCIVRVH